MHRLFITLLVFLSCLRLQSQELDSLVFFSDLRFSSVFEEMIFYQLEKGQEPELVNLYLAIDVKSETEAAGFRSQLESLVTDYRSRGIQAKKETKQVKQIYEQTHESMMVQYEEKAFFPDLFRDGSFNCVTGSMVYSLIFSEFNIPFSIQKGMNHVSLVAFPDSHTILVESTDSEGGVIMLDKGDKEDYVNTLSRGKLITEDERMQNNIASIFQHYAFEESDIDELELASFQYFNRAVFEVEEMNFEEAFRDFEKAFYLKPGKELALMLLQSGGQVLHMSNYEDPSDVELLVKLSRFREFGITDDVVLDEFTRITQKAFYDRGDSKFYEEAFGILRDELESSELVKKISLSYYSVLISSLAEEGQLQQTLQYVDDLYSLAPDDKRIHNLIKEIIISALSSSYMSVPAEMIFLNAYREQVPVVFEIPIMRLIYMSTQAENAAFWFDQGDQVKGSEYLTALEEEVSNNVDIQMIAGEITLAYQTAAFYYYNRGNTRKTREVLNRGLEILPNSRDLLRLKSSI